MEKPPFSRLNSFSQEAIKTVIISRLISLKADDFMIKPLGFYRRYKLKQKCCLQPVLF
jgi:hypothetical protein